MFIPKFSVFTFCLSFYRNAANIIVSYIINIEYKSGIRLKKRGVDIKNSYFSNAMMINEREN